MKSLIIAALFAVSASVALAAPARTSKPVALSDGQMKVVKGQNAFLYVYVWNYNGSGEFYTQYIAGQNIGYTGYQIQLVYAGGPNAGTNMLGYEAPPINGQSSLANPWTRDDIPITVRGAYDFNIVLFDILVHR